MLAALTRYNNVIGLHNRLFWCRSISRLSVRSLQGFSSSPAKAVSPEGCSTSHLDFTDHKRSFQEKTIWDLTRAMLVLGICSKSMFSKNSARIFDALVRWLGSSLSSALVKPLFYNQFVGGETAPEMKLKMKEIARAGSGTFVLMVLEAIERSEDAVQNHSKIVAMMEGLADHAESHTNYMQMRISALFASTLLKELSLLSIEERERFIHSAATFMKTGHSGSLDWLKDISSISDRIPELLSGLELLENIGEKAVTTDTVLMIDAEYTSTNPALTALALALSLRCNTDKPIVWNTIQCYLKSSFDAIQWEFKFAMENNLHFGAKMVRGAYIVPETKAAELGGYPCPVHDGIKATSKSFNSNVEWLLGHIYRNENQGRQIRFVLASHNQESIRQAVDRMNSFGICAEDRKMLFAQIYGMCDHITYTLGKAGYPVYKSIPAGSVNDSLPYLSRRSQENTAIIANSRQERQLLKAELIHRLMR